MPNYVWRGIDINGNYQKGEILSESVEQLKKMLLNDNITTFNVREKRVSSIFSFLKKEKNISEQGILFFHQLSVLLKRGVDLIPALELSRKYLNSKKIKDVIKVVINDVSQGKNFSLALKNHSNIFDNFISTIVESGEKSGKLDLLLEHLVSYLKMRNDLNKKIKNAALLPLITLFFSFLLIIGVFVGVIPQFESLFQSSQKSLPVSTQYLFKMSAFLVSYKILWIFLAIVIGIFFLKILMRNKKIYLWKDKFVLSLYGIGKIVLLFNIICFVKTFSVLLCSGVPLKQAIKQSGFVIKNLFLQQHVLQLADMIEKGESLEKALINIGTKYIPENFSAVVAVGEKSGNLGDMIGQASEFFNEELFSHVHSVTTIFQPILLVGVGIIVGFIMLAIYLPIFTMANVIYL
jgi:type IV pilus assembly protein PilC